MFMFIFMFVFVFFVSDMMILSKKYKNINTKLVILKIYKMSTKAQINY